MTETNSCVDKDALIDYLYGEVDADARTRVEAHLRSCEQCADEVRGLTDVRGTLEAWIPPAPGLGFRVVSDAYSEPAPVSFLGRLRRPPAWGLASAAVLVLAAAASIAKPELEIGRGEMVLRLGWSDTVPAAATQAGAEPASRSDQATQATAVDDEWLLQSTRQLLFEEELIANRRQADLSELQRAFGEFDRTGAELARQQLLEVLRRVSAR
jgi:anti-sigma factor RsiW